MGRSFELHSPWWAQGTSEEGKVIYAAIMAKGESEARAVVFEAQDVPHNIAFSLVEEKPDDWSPFTDEFPRADWMKWPAEKG